MLAACHAGRIVSRPHSAGAPPFDNAQGDLSASKVECCERGGPGDPRTYGSKSLALLSSWVNSKSSSLSNSGFFTPARAQQ